MKPGTYYFFDCLDGIIGDKYLTPEDLHELMTGKREPYSERQMIRIAGDYEATLIRYQFGEDGEEIESKTLYDPWSIFGGDEDE